MSGPTSSPKRGAEPSDCGAPAGAPLFFSAGAVSSCVASARQRVSRPGRTSAGLGLAALLALSAVFLPDRCLVNEVGHVRAARTGDLTLGPAPRGEQAARFAAACPSEDGADDSGIRRAPYLQKVGTGAAEVLWTGDRLARPHVALRQAGAGAGIDIPAAPDPSAQLPRGVQYVARLQGLEPATIYCYEVHDGGRRLAGPHGFTTAPRSGRPIRLVAFGDMGWRSTDQAAVLDQMSRVEFDLALLAGDIAYPDGTLDQLERNFFAVYAPLMRSAPFYPASGNHDYLTSGAAPFRQAFSLPENGGEAGRERWYSFDWGDLHVVVLDSEVLGPAQTRWLDADLAGTRAPWVIAVVHRAPFGSGERGPDLPTRRALVPILTRHRVPLVLAGHEHHYERLYPPGGGTYVVTGGGGRGTRRILEARAEYSAFAAQVAHFVYISIEGDRLRLWAIDASGQTFDTATLARMPRPAG